MTIISGGSGNDSHTMGSSFSVYNDAGGTDSIYLSGTYCTAYPVPVAIIGNKHIVFVSDVFNGTRAANIDSTLVILNWFDGTTNPRTTSSPGTGAIESISYHNHGVLVDSTSNFTSTEMNGYIRRGYYGDIRFLNNFAELYTDGSGAALDAEIAQLATPLADDFASTVLTTGIITAGGSVQGNIGTPTDNDWFGITLQAGHTYRIDLKGSASSAGTLVDPMIEGIHNASGVLISGTTNDDIISGTQRESRVDYVCTTNGKYYISAAAFNSSTQSYTGTYTLSVTDTNPSATSLTGTSANDSFTGRAGNDAIDGGAGRDTVNYSISRSSFTVTKTSTGFTVTDRTGANGTDTLANVERLHFSDGNLALDTGLGQNGGEAYRIYKAAFNRTPDTTGLAYWLGQIDSSMSLTQVAQGFVDSSEFRTLYGTNPTTSQFVDRLYHNVLGRAGEANGVAYWEGRLNSGAESMAQVLTGFSESAENVALVGVTIENGFVY